MQIYFPQAGDSDETVKAKRGLLQAQLNQLIAQSGGTYDVMSQAIQQRQNAAGGHEVQMPIPGNAQPQVSETEQSPAPPQLSPSRQIMGSAGVPIVPEAVQMLRNDPSSAPMFDQTFGEGMSEYFLGGQPGPKAEELIGSSQPGQNNITPQYAQRTRRPDPNSDARDDVIAQARQSGLTPEIGASREFSPMGQDKWDELRSSIHRLPPAEQMRVAEMITAKFGGSARQDEQGRIYVTVPSGEYLLNAPGMTRQAVDSLSQARLAPGFQSGGPTAVAVDQNPYARFAPQQAPSQPGTQATSTPSNPYAQFVQQPADPQQGGMLDDIALGVGEAGKSIAQAGVNTVNIIPEIGDAVQSAAAWVGKQVGISDGTYTPAARLSLPESLRPQTTDGQVAAEALPYLVNPTSSLARNASGAGAKIAGLAAENMTGVLAANSNQQDEGKLVQDIGTSMALSGATRTVANAIGAGYRAVKGQIAPEARAAIDFAEQNNVPLMTSDIKQPQTFVGRSAQQVGEKIPFAGTGQMRANQQQARSRLVDDFSQRYGTYSRDDVVSSLRNKTDTVRKAAGARFNEIRTRMDTVGNIAPQKSISAIDNEITHLSRLGRVSDTNTIARLRDYREELSNGKITFSLLDDLRTQFRTDVRGERTGLPDRSTVSLNRVYDGMTEDLNAAIRKELGSRDVGRWSHAKAVYAQEAQKIKNTRIKNILMKGS